MAVDEKDTEKEKKKADIDSTINRIRRAIEDRGHGAQVDAYWMAKAYFG